MNYKSSFLAFAATAAAFMFLACTASIDLNENQQGNQQGNGGPVGPTENELEAALNWNHPSGDLEIQNNSIKNMVLFAGEPSAGSLIGGVRAGTTRLVDISKYVTDKNVGGYMIMRAITFEEYEKNIGDLSKAKIEVNAMATYGPNQRYRINLESSYMGDYGFRVNNVGKIGMELRKNGPEGEKIAYLPALQQNQMVYTSTTDALTMFPVFVFFDKRDGSVTTVKATELTQSVMAAPRPILNSSAIQTYTLPNNPDLSWESLLKTLKSPVAYVTVTNNVMNQAVYFTNAGSTYLVSQSGYDAVGSGEQLVFEIESTDANEDGTGGSQKQLVVNIYGGLYKIPVRKKLEDGTFDTEPPFIKNGYDYTVSVNQNGDDYNATIIESSKPRDISEQLESL